MNEKRSPVTKLFDDIRREFTVIENAIDPTKVDTIPYKLQQYRNQYAAKKRAEEEKRRQEEYKRQQAEQARIKLRQDIEGDFKAQFQTYLNQSINWLTTKDNSVTLENYNTVYSEVKNFSVSLPADWLHNLHTLIRIPANISVDELRQFETDTKERLGKQFTEQYTAEIQDNKDFILDRLPSRKQTSNAWHKLMRPKLHVSKLKWKNANARKPKSERQNANAKKRKKSKRRKWHASKLK